MIRLGGQEAEFFLHEKGALPTVSCVGKNEVGRLAKSWGRARFDGVYDEQLTARRLPQSGGGAA